MKRLISSILLLAMILSLLAGCSQGGTTAPETTGAPNAQPETVGVDNNLADAVAYVKNIYKDATELTAADYQRIGVVPMGADKYVIEWTANVSENLVKITKNADGMVTIDVNEEAEEETPYVLTATLTGTDGKQESLSWNHILPKAIGDDYGAIVDMGYALEDGQSLTMDATLVGTISTINTAWSDEYGNITVTIIVEGREDKPIMCYRLAGEGAKDLAPGDLITVTGVLKNYKGTIEFDAGCTLDAVEAGAGTVVSGPTDPAEIIAAAYALEQGQSLAYPSTLTGKISAVNTAWSDQYKNITVTIKVDGFEDKPIMCYRLKGEGAEDLFADDVITVTGTLKNYGGTIEFDAGCNLDAVTPGPRIPITFAKQPDSYAQIMEDAYNLPDGNYLPYNVYIRGTVTKINQAWSDRYGNISVTMVLEGAEDKPLYVYRMVGYQNGASEIEVGDIITVHGSVQNYKGTIEVCKGCWLMKLEKGDGSYVPPTEPEDPDGTAYSIAKANEVALKKDHNEYTTNKFSVTGVIKEIVNDKYGNLYITDGTNDLYVYGTYDASGNKRFDKMDVKPVAGDTITVYGILGTYNKTAQMKNGWIIAHTPAAPTEPSIPDTTEPSVPDTTEPAAPQKPATLAEQLAEAAKLENSAILPYDSTMTGTITNDPQKSTRNEGQYNFYISDGTNSVQCYYVKCGAYEPKKGDTVTVTGPLSAYKGKPQFTDKSNCVLVTAAAPAEPTEPTEPVKPATWAEQYAEAAAMTTSYLPYTSTFTGVVEGEVKTGTYNGKTNYTFTLVGSPDGVAASILCHQINVEDGVVIKTGDTVTITDNLSAYKGTPQFKYDPVALVIVPAA